MKTNLKPSKFLVSLAGALACSAAAAVPVVAVTFPHGDWLPVLARVSPHLAARLKA